MLRCVRFPRLALQSLFGANQRPVATPCKGRGDDELRTFKKSPLHNWASHAADAFRYLSMAWRRCLNWKSQIASQGYSGRARSTT